MGPETVVTLTVVMRADVYEDADSFAYHVESALDNLDDAVPLKVTVANSWVYYDEAQLHALRGEEPSVAITLNPGDAAYAPGTAKKVFRGVGQIVYEFDKASGFEIVARSGGIFLSHDVPTRGQDY